MIDVIVSEKSKGNTTLISTNKTKLLLRGIDCSKYDNNSSDEPDVISKLQGIANEFGIKLN